MASEIKVTPENEEMLEEEGPESPPLDLSERHGPAPQRQEAWLRH